MLISVIIPTCNRNDLLDLCLERFTYANQITRVFDYEVIVTDDSKGNSAKTLIDEKYNGVKWIPGPKKGPASNRNNGAKSAIGEWLIFIDDDCLPQVDLIDRYYEAIQNNPDTEVFEGCIKVDRPSESFTEESPINESGGYLWSCNFMIKKALFIAINGFDEGFPYPAMEDVELDYRLKQLERRILFVKDAFVVHPWRTQKRMYAVTLERFQSLLYFLKKHPEQAKKLNTMYYLRMVLFGVRDLITKSFQYKFKGFGGKFIWILLHFYFALYFAFNKNEAISGN